MEIKAKLSNLRIAPRKVRLVADLIRGKKTKEAQVALNFAVKKSSLPLLKLLNSAIANAKNNFQMEQDNLYISKITVDEGPKYKRWMPRARGVAYEIQKKTSHITLVLKEISESKTKKRTKPAKIKKEKISKEIQEQQEKETPEKETFQEILKEKKKDWQEKRFDIPKSKVNKGIRRFFQRKVV